MIINAEKFLLRMTFKGFIQSLDDSIEKEIFDEALDAYFYGRGNRIATGVIWLTEEDLVKIAALSPSVWREFYRQLEVY